MRLSSTTIHFLRPTYGLSPLAASCRLLIRRKTILAPTHSTMETGIVFCKSLLRTLEPTLSDVNNFMLFPGFGVRSLSIFQFPSIIDLPKCTDHASILWI